MLSTHILNFLNKNLSLKDYLQLGTLKKKNLCVKPLTFMNNSGTAIKELIDYFKIDAKDVIVFHDDMDIDFGKIKAKFGGTSAGHNGNESIDKFIGKIIQELELE